MNYEISLNKSAVISIVVASVLLSVLFFGAGLVVGSQWLIGTAAAASDANAKSEQSELPKEPVLNDDALKEAQAPRPKAAAPQTLPPVNAPAAATEKPAMTAPEQAIAKTAGAKVADTKLTAEDVKIIQETAPESTGDDNAASEPDYVTVQVGVFLDQSEASRLLKEIERKGYAPTFFSGRDAEARQWYAVRIGAYSDKQQAANAAANFTKQEKIKATVRPLGSL